MKVSKGGMDAAFIMDMDVCDFLEAMKDAADLEIEISKAAKK